MRRVALGCLMFLALVGAAMAQTASTGRIVSACGTPGITYTAGAFGPFTVDTNGNLCSSGGGGGGGAVTIANGADTAEGSTTDAVCTLPASTAACTIESLNKAIANVLSFAAASTSSITRSSNTTTYTANTGWNNGTPTFFSFTAACRTNGGQVLIPEIDIWSSANPTTKLQGILWLFAAVPGTNVSDDATFTIASADYANLTGNRQGFPFTLANDQASGAANSGVTLAGTNYQVRCANTTTTITGMVQVVNAYVPASAEVLSITLNTLGMN